MANVALPQSKGYFAQFKHLKGLMNEMGKIVPLE